MFSSRQKQEIAAGVQLLLRATNHPELSEGEISFQLHVDGAESWAWANIRNNGCYTPTNKPSINPENEAQDLRKDPAEGAESSVNASRK